MSGKKSISALNRFLFGTENSMLLEEKMLITALVIGIIASIIGAFMNFFLGYSIPALIVPLLLILFLVLLFYFVRFKKKYSALIIPFAMISFIGIGIIWIFNGGYNGTNTLVMYTVLVLALCVAPTNNFLSIYIFFISLILSLHFFQYFFPDLVTQFPSEKTRFIDTSFTVFYTSSLIYLTITFLIKNYRRERQTSIERGKKLEELNKELAHNNASKDKLFSIIAHDLKSPFNGILGMSELMLSDLKSYDIEMIQEFLKNINSTSRNTLTLLENLLAWSKSEAGLFDFNPEILKLEKIVNKVLGVLDSSFKLKNISFNYFQSEELEINVDKNMFELVLRNLISNAIKFTHPGGKISIYALSRQNTIEISISDNGIGIDEATLNKLFRIDTNITSKGTADESGSGLGLILCKEFIEKHGGEIWVQSQIGKGSDFKFTLPLHN